MSRRKKGEAQKMLSKPACVDDFGDSVFRCRYTNETLLLSEVQTVGALIPGVYGSYAIAKSEKASALHKQNVQSFHASERNCNHCKQLERPQQEKHSSGFLLGRCKKSTTELLYPLTKLPYSDFFGVKEVMQFHPDDAMHMQCWESRA